MTSKQEPYKLHAAIFPSLATIEAMGGSDLSVTQIDARFTRNVGTTSNKIQSKFIKRALSQMRQLYEVRWNVEETGTPTTIKEILRDLRLNGIPDAILKKITFAMPWVQFNNYTLKNEELNKSWTFRPYTFRKGVWKRLKALSNYPGKALYEEYCRTKEELVNDLDQPTRKRWRDTILMNEPHPELDNAEFRSFWIGKRFTLLLKESRGSFDLMDIGEWRA